MIAELHQWYSISLIVLPPRRIIFFIQGGNTMPQQVEDKKLLITIAILLFTLFLFSHRIFLPTCGNYCCAFICFCIFFLAYRIQKKAEENTRNYYEIETLTNHMNGGIVTYALDDKLSIMYANDGFYNLIGYSREEVKNKFNNSGLSFMGSDELLAQINALPKTPENINLEYKLKRKDNSTIWIKANCHKTLNSHSVNTISYFMMDITDSKIAEQELILEKERYHIATELTNDIIFEYDIAKDQINHSAKYQDFFGRAPLIYNFSKNLDNFTYVSPTTLEALKNLCNDFHSGKPTVSTELKLLDAYNRYTWCHIKGKTIFDSKGNPSKIIGKIVNIDAQKKTLEELQNKAYRDPLTGLYNKTVTKNLIERILSSKNNRQHHAFMIIDIDNFKAINDTLGHLTGDDVLINVTSQLTSLFGQKDIVGRIGGDEFVVFMSEINSTKDVFLKAKTISRALRYDYQTDDKECSITGSIGISIYPNDGQNYTDLLKSADNALYQIKKHGKNNFAMANSLEKYYF